MKRPDQLAAELWQARRTGLFCDPIEEPLSIEQAYAIQTACTELAQHDEKVIGYKIGATNEETLGILALDEPFYGPLYQSALLSNNGLQERLPLSLFLQHKSRVEAEFVVCMKDDVRKTNNAVVLNDILDHVAWVAPGLEIVASRFREPNARPGTLAIADFGANQFMVVGEPYANWRDLDLTQHPVTLTIDDQEDVQGHSGLSIFGNPLEFVCWLLNQPGMQKTGLKAGQMVSCGTCTGAPFVRAGDQVTADYGLLGRLAVQMRQ